MAVRTERTATCDGCGKRVEKVNELRKFRLEEYKMSGSFVAVAVTELCTDCESALHKAMLSFWPAEELANLEGIVRP